MISQPRSDFDLESALDDLRATVGFPSTPEISRVVAERLRQRQWQPSAPRMTPHRWPLPKPFRRGLALAVLAAVLVVGTAVGVGLGLGGLRLTFVDGTPRPVLAPELVGELRLGDPVTLDEARERVDFPIVLPTLEELSTPDAVYVSDVPPGGQVVLLYAEADLPADTATAGDIGLLFTQFRADIGPGTFEKILDAGVRVESVTVSGRPGYWIEGGQHVLRYLDANGREVTEMTRLIGDALIWEQDGLTLRIEGAESLDGALRIAASVR